MPLKCGDEIELNIDAAGSEGQGIGRYRGAAVFVPLALAGERVTARVERVNRSYAEAELLSVLEPSPCRAEPDCRAFPECGGCDLRHISYEAQLELKRCRVRDALERIGGFEGINVMPTLGMDAPYRYRNKAAFPFVTDGGAAASGYFARKSHRLIRVADCKIQDERSMTALHTVEAWANRFGVDAYDESTKKGILRHLVVRHADSGTMAVIVTTGALPHSDELIKMLKDALPGLVSVIHCVNKGRGDPIFGAGGKPVYGCAALEERMGGLVFEVSAESFLQVNPIQTRKLYELAINGLALSPNDNVVDLYCGIGTVSLSMAPYVRSVTGVETVVRAVNDAKRNAARNGIKNAEFIAGKAEHVLPRLIREGRHVDALVLDPPRKGADRAALDAIIAGRIPRIAYIACDPSTLARDCRILADGGYSIVSTHPVDMFPMTKHVECVVLMSRVKN